jgi:hypothetical protein
VPGHAVQRRRQDVQGELLDKLHNAAVARLRDNHHQWFEGFELSAITEKGAPMCALLLGS